MLAKRIFCALTALLIFLPLEHATAQPLRRSLQRLSELLQEQTPAYRVAPANEPLVQGDGRLLERIQTLVGSVAGQGLTELKPVAVVSLASFEDYKLVLQTIAQKIRLNDGSTEEPALLNAFLNIYGSIVGRGFDTRQPMGLLLMTDGLLYYPLLFTPLDLNSKLGQSMQNDYAQRLPDGRYVLRQDKFHWAFGQLYVQQKNGWVFIAPEKLLNALPDDPAALLHGLDKKHLAAARFDLQNLPVLSTRAALALGEMSATAQAESEFDKAATRLSFNYLRSLAEQTDVLEYTASYDDVSNDYVLEQKESVKPNTERAKYLRYRREAASIFGGFYRPRQAILAAHLVMDLTKPQQKELEKMLDETIGKHLLTDEERKHQTEGKKADAALSKAAIPETGDPRDKLAALLSAVPPEEFDEPVNPNADAAETSQQYFLSPTPDGTMDEPKKLQVLLRRIGAAYYWALLGAVRSGHVDGAATWSAERGMFGAFKLTEGEPFAEAFDTVFAEVEEKFPDFYQKNVEKDFAETAGFRLTAVRFNAADLLRETLTNPLLRSIVPEEFSQRNIRLILGVRDDAVCFAMGEGLLPERQIAEAAAQTLQVAQRVEAMFFVFSGYELGQAFASSGDPLRFVRLKALAANTDPKARAYAVSSFTDTSKTLTLRISGLLTPSLWKLRQW